MRGPGTHLKLPLQTSQGLYSEVCARGGGGRDGTTASQVSLVPDWTAATFFAVCLRIGQIISGES